MINDARFQWKIMSFSVFCRLKSRLKAGKHFEPLSVVQNGNERINFGK